jgi:uncharacterized protein YrzB (UPF0473 family)
MLEENQMIVVDENGVESVCEILFTHAHGDKEYVIFEFVDSGVVSAARFVPGETGEEGTLEDIETEEEWDMIDEVLEAYYDEIDALDESETDEDDEEEEKEEVS